MKDIIERLRKEKSEDGKGHGRAWAESAHYDDIEWVLDWNPQPGDDPTRLGGEDLEHIEEYFREIIDSDRAMGFDMSGHANKRVDRFVHGWLMGVKEFWSEVEGKLSQ